MYLKGWETLSKNKNKSYKFCTTSSMHVELVYQYYQDNDRLPDNVILYFQYSSTCTGLLSISTPLYMRIKCVLKHVGLYTGLKHQWNEVPREYVKCTYIVSKHLSAYVHVCVDIYYRNFTTVQCLVALTTRQSNMMTHFHYTMRKFTWDSLTYSKNTIQ